ncbi:polysaccharide ABC transporter ATP-binding protein [Ramlibacter rhizophilus]|uniref:ATP-binding cassette domain-containing protein n=1 Tax=Ramlibacter rhizophilus TaxID=1781167 RepID=A0A4Z0BK32_9BURK|nr:ABC transporter ATP-binding protein [Ramlibacter rhizophilus]TFY99672.1 ATP-binding cassette domain-containing protein [Ramlibacter rhizophilus]
MSATAITINTVTKHFPKTGRIGMRALFTGIPPDQRFTAVDRVSLRVPKGEVVGVLGRNGAGKSTLLRLVGGIYSPDGGSVALTGDLAGLFELGGFGNTQLTGREFAFRYLDLFGVNRGEQPAIVDDIHDFSELGAYFDERIRTYSAGMSARLYFAAATAIPHEIYLIDEILSVGDEHFQAKSWARMRERLAGGASGLLVTHDWSAVIKLCRESRVMDAGRVVLAGRSDAVVAGYLDLPLPAADRARLLEPPPEALRAESGRDCTLSFDIEVLEPIAVRAAVSIEVLQLGVGWEPVILTEFQDAGRGPGRLRIELNIPALPLGPGEYSLSFFLNTAPDPHTGSVDILDARAWTYGNGLVFTVTGEDTGCGVAPFPVRWSEEP